MKKTIVFGIIASILYVLLTGCSNNSSVDGDEDISPANNTLSSNAPVHTFNNSDELQAVNNGEPSIQVSAFAEYIAQGYEIEIALGSIALVHPDLGWNEADAEGFTARFNGDGRLTIATDGFNVFREVEGMTREELSDVRYRHTANKLNY
jgi:hypothetical protein